MRSYHLLRHLARSHTVFLGTFVDEKADRVYLPRVERYCAEMHVACLNPNLAKLKSLTGLVTGEALTLPYYRDAGLRKWVERTLLKKAIDVTVVFSSAMAQYVPSDATQRMLVDFVDVDSAKWGQYASAHRWPMSWIYRREGKRLLQYECDVARRASHSFFVTEEEAGLFQELAPECGTDVEAIMNGVDADFYCPTRETRSPYPAGTVNIVFTGAMDYWPNIDAVTWFAREVFPNLRAKRPELNFVIVGRNPAAVVANLAGNGVTVTGTVADVRPYLQYADVVVAPMRLARGVQNKILEAMAMGRPVVAASSCVQAIGAETGRDLFAANDVADYMAYISQLLRDHEQASGMGRAGRAFVQARYSWDAHLAKMDAFLSN